MKIRIIMDSDNFFGFDTSLRIEEGEEVYDDDEYDALNDETFGSAAVGGDWEENHKQLSSLTEAERLQRAIGKDVNDIVSRSHEDRIKCPLENFQDSKKLTTALVNVNLEKPPEQKRLYERSVDSSPLFEFQKEELSSSPGSSIWSPTIGVESFETLKQLGHNFQSQPRLITPNNEKDLRGFNFSLCNTVPSSVKTVSELEEELKRQHLNNHNVSKLSALNVSDLEKEIVRQATLKKPNDLHTQFLGVRGLQTNVSNAIHPSLANLAGILPAAPPLNVQRNLGDCKPTGVFQNPLQFPHHLLYNGPQKVPPGYLNSVPSVVPRLNQQQRGHNSRNIFNSCGSSQGKNNMNRNSDQGHRHDQNRNNFDHQREKMTNQTGNRVRRDSDAEWEEWQRIRQLDEYCGLMTPREKSWLRNIQAMQLQTENPYQDDYYYVMHNVKQQKRREEEVIEIDGLKLLIPDRGKEGKEYEPPRLENSLGKLQVVSVNAPRKIIDLQVIHLDSSHPATSLQKDMRKHRHLLMHIEKLYSIHIELDDLERKIRALPDCPTRDLFRSKCRQLVNKLWIGVTQPHETFVQILCIRKGKTLIARLLSWVGQTEIEHLLATVVQNLFLITKKDSSDKRLPLFWPYADRFFSSSSVSSLVSFGIMMGPQLKDKKKPSIPALSSKLGLSMVMSMLVRGEELWPELEKDEAWHQFLRDVVLALSQMEYKMDSNIHPLPSVNLAVSCHHPSSHLIKCVGVEPAALKVAVEVLKKYELYLSKSCQSNYNSSTTSSSFVPDSQIAASHTQTSREFLTNPTSKTSSSAVISC